MQILTPTVSTQHLGELFLCCDAGLIKGLNLFMCSLDLRGRSLSLHFKILSLTCESSATPVRLVRMPCSSMSSDSPHLPDMLILIQSILQLLSRVLLRLASENVMSVPLCGPQWVKKANTALSFVPNLTF